MKMGKDGTMLLKDIVKGKKNFKLDPEFQRNEVWSRRMESELFDSIVDGLPLPKVYLRRTRNGRYHVIDGKQRMLAFLNIYLGNIKSALGLTYKQLPADIKKEVDNFVISVVYCDGNDLQIREIFRKLNSGKPLTVNEKNHADTTRPIYPVIKALSEHSIISTLSMATTRYQHESWLSQCSALVWQYLTGTTYQEIGNKYVYLDLDSKSEKDKLTNRIEKVLDAMQVSLRSYSEDLDVSRAEATEIFWIYFKLMGQGVDLSSVNGKELTDDYKARRMEYGMKNTEYYDAIRASILGKKSTQQRMNFVDEYVKNCGLVKKGFALSL